MMTLKKAFYEAISQRGIYKELNIDRCNLSNYKKWLKYEFELQEGGSPTRPKGRSKMPSTNKMREVLNALGWAKATDEKWVKLQGNAK